MKKITITTLCLLLGFIVFSQEKQPRFQVKIYGGYGLLTPGSFRSGTSQTNTSGAVNFNSNKQGFGAGIHAGIGFSYIVNDAINLGVDGDYLLGKEIGYHSTGASTYSTYQNENEYTRTYTHKIISIIPNITLKAISKPNYYVYTRLGLQIGIPQDLTIISGNKYNYDYTNGDFLHVINESSGSYSKNLGFGYLACLGVQFKLSGKIRVFGEITASSLTLIPKEFKDDKNFNTTISRTGGIESTGTTHNLNIVKFESSGQYVSSSTGTDPVITTYVASTTYISINSISPTIGIAIRF